jgi:hypothetical protein
VVIQSKEQGRGIDAEGMKEIKVRIPIDFHWRLHTLRLMNGTHISDVVRNALEDYFTEVFNEEQNRPRPPG